MMGYQRRFKKKWNLLYCILVLMPFSLFAKPVLKVVFYPMPPWVMEKNGKVYGPEVELVQRLAKKANVKLKIINVPFARALFLLQDGQVDLATGFLFEKEWSNFLFYVLPPYMRHRNIAFYYLRKNKLKIRNYEDLVGLRVGVTQKALYFKRFDEEYQIIKDAVSDNYLNFNKLLKGRIDVLVCTESFGDLYIKNNKLSDVIKKAPYVYKRLNPVYVVFSFRSLFIKKLQPILSSMILTGESDSIFYRFFIRHHIKIPRYH